MNSQYQINIPINQLSDIDENNFQIELFTQNIPEPSCVLLRWRFLVQAQFYTHMGYTLQINNNLKENNKEQDNEDLTVHEIKINNQN